MQHQKLIEDYQRCKPALDQQAAELQKRLSVLLDESGIPVHDISARVKSAASLVQKASRPDRIYTGLEDVTDVIGLRVVTYFEDSIESVAQLIEKHYAVDWERSIDKRLHGDPSRFGYRSLHYVCRLATPQQPLSEFFPFEIQIRTILQHAWAEIEHDLGYKYPEAVPQPVRRRFSRLAGLLEIADAEFVELRKTMDSYAQDLHAGLSGPRADLPWDALSLETLVATADVMAADQRLAAALQKALGAQVFFPDYLIRMLNASGLHNRDCLSAALVEFEPQLETFMHRYFTFTRETWGFHGLDFDSLPRGYTLFLLALWQVFRSATLEIHRLEKLKTFYQLLDYPHNEEEARRVARLFMKNFQDGTE
ncbi:GTP pyrophosphokinase [Oligoflexus tunisiensis]|uniref:GTP pyrophosphokinase n=1 Tax=Oligoflexus tunisiensis TaxID=708132 RepID=UPI000B162831|nr:GTP pyrophosphokinase family protein [Oligoflexus tunisiensis]